MKVKNLIVVFACLSMLTGCASIITHGDKTMPIKTTPSGATVEIKDLFKDKIVSKNTTPFQATLERGDGYFLKKRYAINLSKDGYIQENIELSPELNWVYFGNILLGGLIGMVIVDPATGDMWQYSEDIIDVELYPDTPEGRLAKENNTKEKIAKEKEAKIKSVYDVR